MWGQLVVGPPGAGKTTYCYGLQQFFSALQRPVCLVNLDPAAPSTPYTADINLADLITLQDAMDELNLGPNGGMLYCLEFLEANFDWLEGKLRSWQHEKGVDYFVFDLPGQVELSTDHQSLKRIVERLGKLDYRLAAVHLTDAHHITDASKFVAVLLLALRTMLQMEMPHVNVFSKIDLLAQYGSLPFNLDYYTEVQDLDYLNEMLDQDAERVPRGKKFSQLNKAICELVEDFGLVSFETLCVEDKQSMAKLIKTIDDALGYHSSYSHQHGEGEGEGEDQAPGFDMSQFVRSLDAGSGLSRSSQALDVQERWIDSRDVFDEAERAEWEKEGRIAKQQERQQQPPQASSESQQQHGSQG